MAFRRTGTPAERKYGTLIAYAPGDQALVSFMDAPRRMIPAAEFRRAGITPGARFALRVIRNRDGSVHHVAVERVSVPKPTATRRSLPKVMVRTGRRVVTR